MVDLELADDLHFEPSQAGFLVRSRDDMAADENLVWRAAKALSATLPDVAIAITKRIPMQAGLGGGSADAAAALRGLSRIFEEAGTALTRQQIADAAIRCGSDVPSFLVRGLKAVGGVGEGVTAHECEPPGWGIALVRPAVGSSTAQAYQMLDEAGVPHDLAGAKERVQAMCDAFAAHDFKLVTTLLHNDFSQAIERALPPVGSARGRLEVAGARATILCGSGSCVAGFFESRTAAEDALGRVELAPGEWATATAFCQ
jgi:4-diphosphocytidyl-2-C-methyl-D-erythritol kinase